MSTMPLPDWVNGAPVRLPAKLGRYLLTKKLGQGGMGSVYLAADTQLQRDVAMKLPALDGELDRVRDRFLREARALAALKHPNVCTIYEVGDTDGVLYLTMELVEGRPLSDYVGHESLAVPRLLALLRKVALALQAAHQKGLVHRDLKPANVMVTTDGQPVVMDFGLALDTTSADKRMTGSGVVLGTPHYMAPEQFDGSTGTIGPATDIYALGTIAFEMLTGHTPFEGGQGMGAMMAAILTQPPPPLSRYRPGVRPELEAAVARALAKDPAARFTSMREFAEALTPSREAGGGQRPLLDVPANAAVATPPPAAGGTASIIEPFPVARTQKDVPPPLGTSVGRPTPRPPEPLFDPPPMEATPPHGADQRHRELSSLRRHVLIAGGSATLLSLGAVLVKPNAVSTAAAAGAAFLTTVGVAATSALLAKRRRPRR